MKYLFTALVLTLLFGLPFRTVDAQRLLPLLTIQVAREDGAVRLRSEAGEGVGADWGAAVADLRAQASGEVFFDTAEHIVVCDRDLLPQILRSGVLRPAAQVYFADAFRDVEGLDAYLGAHPSGVTVAQLQSEVTRDA